MKNLPQKLLKCLQNKRPFYSKFYIKRFQYLENNISEYYFERGEMIVNGYNISDIVFLKKMSKEINTYNFIDYIVVISFSFFITTIIQV